MAAASHRLLRGYQTSLQPRGLCRDACPGLDPQVREERLPPPTLPGLHHPTRFVCLAQAQPPAVSPKMHPAAVTADTREQAALVSDHTVSPPA